MSHSGRFVDRRGFLRSSGLFAAAGWLLTSRPMAAQTPQEKPAPEGDAPPADAPAKDEPARTALLDRDGREYRVCDVCGSNMYKQKDTWTCEQCGYSYVE